MTVLLVLSGLLNIVLLVYIVKTTGVPPRHAATRMLARPGAAAPVSASPDGGSRTWASRTRLQTAAGVTVVTVVAILMVVPWHTTHSRVPEWDGAGYVLVAQTIVQAFDEGFLAGLRTFYLERLWRPIIFPQVASLFFLGSSGDILIGVTLTETFCAILVAIYGFLILREIVGPARAVVGASFVVSLTWFVTYTHTYFYSEPLWLGATAGLLFHLSHGLTGKRVRHFIVAGLWFGLMVGVRPAETVILALLPSMAILVWAWRTGLVTLGDIGLATIQIGAAAGAALLKLYDVDGLWVFLFLALATLLAFHYRARFFGAAPILGFVIVAVAFSVAWHLPTMRMLYDWAYSSSFGQWAQLSDQRFIGLSLFDITVRLFRSYAPYMLGAVLAIGSITLIDGKRARSKSQVTAPLLFMGVALLGILPILVLHMMSGTSDERRIMPSVFLLYLGATGLALVPWARFSRWRSATVALLATAQVIAVVGTSLGMQPSALTRLQRYTGTVREPNPTPDPNVAVLEGLLSLGVRKGFVISYTHCLMGTNTCNGNHMPLFEHVAVSTLARERRLPLYMHYFGDLDLSKPDTLAEQILGRDARYVLVDMYDQADFPEIDHAHPFFQHTATFIGLARHGFPPGFTKIGCFDTLSRPMCVFEVVRPEAQAS